MRSIKTSSVVSYFSERTTTRHMVSQCSTDQSTALLTLARSTFHPNFHQTLLKHQKQNNIKYKQKQNDLVALAFYVKSASPTSYVSLFETPESSRSAHVSKGLLLLDWNNEIHSCSILEKKKKKISNSHMRWLDVFFHTVHSKFSHRRWGRNQ